MLIPKEKPYLNGLNSYYLFIDKFVEHLQGEIGSGCLYCRAADQELLVYFDEREVVRGVMQHNGERARVCRDLEPILQSLQLKNYLVTVYYLGPSSIFFWGQLPEFQREKARLQSTDIALPDLIFRFRQKKFSGFLDISLVDRQEGAILFFLQGERKGGSYSWGRGGLDTSDKEYNHLLGILQSNRGTYEIGHFKKRVTPEKTAVRESNNASVPIYFSNLNTAMDEFLSIFLQVVRKKIKTDPFIQLKQKLVDFADKNPILDTFSKQYTINRDG